jgi:hypothetical protein
LQYLIWWEGYEPKNNTWEPLEHLGDSMECLEEFYEKYLNTLKVVMGTGLGLGILRPTCTLALKYRTPAG